jgi:predicted nucleotidyltransferase component of viral defense system
MARQNLFYWRDNLRLVKGIDRFSEDLDFDCKNFSREEFMEMTDSVLSFLNRAGLNAEFREKENPKLSAYRRNIYFPELLYSLGHSAHREERFLIKIECQDQGVVYKQEQALISECGFYFTFPVPGDSILYSMKIAAMLCRSKGRDFYDVMFLVNTGKPDFSFLENKLGITNEKQLKTSVNKLLKIINLKNKSKDFEHLLFNKKNSSRILEIGKYFN